MSGWAGFWIGFGIYCGLKSLGEALVMAARYRRG